MWGQNHKSGCPSLPTLYAKSSNSQLCEAILTNSAPIKPTAQCAYSKGSLTGISRCVRRGYKGAREGVWMAAEARQLQQPCATGKTAASAVKKEQPAHCFAVLTDLCLISETSTRRAVLLYARPASCPRIHLCIYEQCIQGDPLPFPGQRAQLYRATMYMHAASTTRHICGLARAEFIAHTLPYMFGQI